MAYQRSNGRHDWAPMYEQQPAVTDRVYKPAAASQSLEVEDEIVQHHLKQSFAQKYFGGTKRTLRTFAVVAVIVLVINLSWLGYAISNYGIKEGVGEIKTGNCAEVKRLNTWFHLLINILSTLLLTGSNAFMAAYSSPTRQEIDQAHAGKRWLHVGALGVRNLGYISSQKSLVVIILALSSAPFHFLYNSLVYTSLSVNQFYYMATTEGFLTGDSFNLTGPLIISNGVTLEHINHTSIYFPIHSGTPNDDFRRGRVYLDNPADVAWLEWLYQVYTDVQTSAPTWERLDTGDCIKAYHNAYISDRRNVVFVTTAKNATNSVLLYGSYNAEMFVGGRSGVTWMDPTDIVCVVGDNDCSNYASNPASFTVHGSPVEYCLSERSPGLCSVSFSFTIMLVVVATNATKVLAMLWILYRLDAQHLLTCVGDAAISFLLFPDQTTTGMCLAGRGTIINFWRAPVPKPFDEIRKRWGSAISRTRWLTFTFVILAAWATLLFLGIWGIQWSDEHTISGLWSLGFGKINTETAIDIRIGPTDAIPLSIIANSPQIVLSAVYFAYMGIVTAMFTAADWARFAKGAQTLMVGTPSSAQRGTWLFGAPIGYGLGLLALQALAHWLVSQSLFLIDINVVNYYGKLSGVYWRTLGYSPIAIIFALVVGVFMLLSAIILALRRFPAGSPPVVATCSAAISAACHVPSSLMSEAAVYEKLRWGVTDSGTNGVDHCSLAPEKAFESGRAGPPVPGRTYAGMEYDGR